MRLKGLYILDTAAYDLVYGPEERADVARLVDVIAPPQTRASIVENMDLLAQADVIFSGWGSPVLTDEFLEQAPRLKGFFYGGGALGAVITAAVWDRDIAVTCAIAANSIPVAEYTLSNILFSLKHGWRLVRETRELRTFVDRNTAPGCYGSTVGLVSLGAAARAVLKLLAPFEVRVLAYDPFLTNDEATELGVELVALAELFRRSDVVSLHTPHLPETERLITGELLASMKPGGTFINTARAEIVDQDEMLAVAARRRDLQFVLDVAEPEPPPPHSPLYALPNVVLTPHIAGSVGAECRRMGRAMVEELERFLAGRPLLYAVTREDAVNSSHRPMVHAHGNGNGNANGEVSKGASETFVRSSAFAGVPSAG